MLTLILNLIKNNTKPVMCILLTVLLVGSLTWGYYEVTDSYYQKGVQYQQAIYKKEQDALKEQYLTEQKKKDLQIVELNDKVSSLNSELLSASVDSQKKVSALQEEIKKYESSNDGSKRCLSSGWLHIYQNSLPN